MKTGETSMSNDRRKAVTTASKFLSLVGRDVKQVQAGKSQSEVNVRKCRVESASSASRLEWPGIPRHPLGLLTLTYSRKDWLQQLTKWFGTGVWCTVRGWMAGLWKPAESAESTQNRAKAGKGASAVQRVVASLVLLQTRGDRGQNRKYPREIHMGHLMLLYRVCVCVCTGAVHAESLPVDALGRNVTYLLTGRQRVPLGWPLYLRSSWPSRPCLCDPSWGSWCQSSQTLLEASGCWPLHGVNTRDPKTQMRAYTCRKSRGLSPCGL